MMMMMMMIIGLAAGWMCSEGIVWKVKRRRVRIETGRRHEAGRRVVARRRRQGLALLRKLSAVVGAVGFV